jgi:hypothetical protein
MQHHPGKVKNSQVLVPLGSSVFNDILLCNRKNERNTALDAPVKSDSVGQFSSSIT